MKTLEEQFMRVKVTPSGLKEIQYSSVEGKQKWKEICCDNIMNKLPVTK